jgi:glycosyltransferase involved in cell wall biosynthesis
MRILSITAGAAGMYCGSCFRDNALAAELIAQGHDVMLVPVYTPTRTDEANVSGSRVLFGGLNVYLQHKVPLFRRASLLDRLIDAPAVIRALTARSVKTDPRLLGDLTVSMLEGEQGVLRREFVKLVEWMKREAPPDIVNLPNSLLIAMAAPLRRALGRPVCCTLQGEELFLSGLVPPYRERARDLIRRQVPHVDRFIAVSHYCARFMADFLDIPSERIAVVPLGIRMDGYGPRRDPADDTFRVGYFARIAPEKGLRELAEAYVLFRRRTAGTPARLEVAGYMATSERSYLEQVRRTLAGAGLDNEFTYHGEVDREGKLAFLGRLDVLSVPATYDEPKGLFLLEAMAAGVPVVQPDRGAFREVVERTGGGLLVPADAPAALADGLVALCVDRERRADLGRRAYEGVREHYGISRSARELVDAYSRVVGEAQGTGGPVGATVAGS